MEELLTTISGQATAFEADAKLQVEKGNKAAGKRARKVALELINNLKEFRKRSSAAVKSNG